MADAAWSVGFSHVGQPHARHQVVPDVSSPEALAPEFAGEAYRRHAAVRGSPDYRPHGAAKTAQLVAGAVPVVLCVSLSGRRRKARRCARWLRAQSNASAEASSGTSDGSGDVSFEISQSTVEAIAADKSSDKPSDEPSDEPLRPDPSLEEHAKATQEALKELAKCPSVWVNVSGAYVMRPPAWVPQRGVLHFIGGAFFGAAPQWTYRSFLSALCERGFCIIATPTATSFDHMKLVAATTEMFERVYQELSEVGLVDTSLPVYGVGHSMGALLSALIGCGQNVPKAYSERLRGQALISFNAQSLSGAVPLWREVWAQEEFRPAIGDLARNLQTVGESKALQNVVGTALDVTNFMLRAAGLEGGAAVVGGSDRVKELYKPFLDQLPPLLKDVESGIDDFAPGDAELTKDIFPTYPSTLPVLLVRFAGDPIDQTSDLERVLKARSPSGDVHVVELSGSHVSPNFVEPPEFVDGTDALGRAAIGVETPIDFALLNFGADLSGLVDALDEYLPASAESQPDDVTAEPGAAPMKLSELAANDFRHPLDRRQTRALERIPGLNQVVRQTVAIVEQAVYQDNVSSSVLVSERQYPWIFERLIRACDILAIPDDDRPEVYIRQNPIPNAYTLAVRGKRPFIVVHTALLDLCCEDEVEVVIAHELGHLKCEHGTWLSAANVLLLGASTLPLPARILGPLLERVQEDLLAWQRAAELTCDRAALLVAQEPWVPLSVLVKLAGGGSARSDGGAPLSRDRIEAFLGQAKRYDEARAEASPIAEMLGVSLRGGRPLTHPLPVLRAREMRRWASSEQFQQLLCKKGVDLTAEPPADAEQPTDGAPEAVVATDAPQDGGAPAANSDAAPSKPKGLGAMLNIGRATKQSSEPEKSG